jgi:hypothetical protein
MCVPLISRMTPRARRHLANNRDSKHYRMKSILCGYFLSGRVKKRGGHYIKTPISIHYVSLCVCCKSEDAEREREREKREELY